MTSLASRLMNARKSAARRRPRDSSCLRRASFHGVEIRGRSRRDGSTPRHCCGSN